MKAIKKSIIAIAAVALAVCSTACTDACDYLDNNTNNPSFGTDHPEAVAGSVWNRADLKKNADGQSIMGYIEKLDFFKEDSVDVIMSDTLSNGSKINVGSDGKSLFSTATWKNESAKYKYEYNSDSGTLTIFEVDKKGSRTVKFNAVVTTGAIVVSHTTDVPSQTYLTKE